VGFVAFLRGNFPRRRGETEGGTVIIEGGTPEYRKEKRGRLYQKRNGIVFGLWREQERIGEEVRDDEDEVWVGGRLIPVGDGGEKELKSGNRPEIDI